MKRPNSRDYIQMPLKTALMTVKTLKEYLPPVIVASDDEKYIVRISKLDGSIEVGYASDPEWKIK